MKKNKMCMVSITTFMPVKLNMKTKTEEHPFRSTEIKSKAEQIVSEMNAKETDKDIQWIVREIKFRY